MKYKTFEQMKKELGDNYDILMYEMNLEMLKKIHDANGKIHYMFNLSDDEKILNALLELKKIIGVENHE